MNETLAVMIWYDLVVTVKRNSGRNSKWQNVHVVIAWFLTLYFQRGRERERERERAVYTVIFSLCALK